MPLRPTSLALAASLVIPAVALAQSAGTTTGNGPSRTGEQFLQQVRSDSDNEVQEALTATQRSTNPAVLAYARLLIVDHTGLISELNAIKPGSAATATASPGSRSQDSFSSGNGSQFDQAFITHEVQQNQQSLSSWQTEANRNGDIGTFAEIGLAVQQQHLALARAIQAHLQSGSHT